MSTDNFTIRQEGSALVARTASGSFLAAVTAPTNKRYLKAAQQDVAGLARDVVTRTVQACEQQRESLSCVQAA